MKLFRPRTLATLLSACAGAAMALAASAPQPDASALPQVTEATPVPGEQGPLVAEGEAPDLALIYTGGVVGYVEPCG